MPLFQTKRVELNAMQFTEESKQEVFNWIRGEQMNIQPARRDGKPVLIVPFIKNILVVPHELDEEICEIGDYLIEEGHPTVWSKYRVCKKDVFETMYAPVWPYAYRYFELLLHLIEISNSVIKEENLKYKLDKESMWNDGNRRVGYVAMSILRNNEIKIRMRKDFEVPLYADIEDMKFNAREDVAKCLIYSVFTIGVNNHIFTAIEKKLD